MVRFVRMQLFDKFRSAVWLGLFAGISFFAHADGDFQGSTHMVPFDEGATNYNNSVPTNAVSQLQQRLAKQEAKLGYSAEHGYLDSLLAELKISKSSQVLVFSKTSFQRDRISPATPRALFFNDDTYVGFIPGAPLIELSTADSKWGGMFYTVEQDKDMSPKLARNDQCLECHATGRSMGVPGHVLRSFVTDESGSPDLNTGISEINHRTPIEDRWGGWYVTGKHGAQTHRGNLIGAKAFAEQEKHPNYLGNQTDLRTFFDVSRYPTTNSDIVALLVLEHQTHMHNFLARLRYESDLQLARYGHINYVTNIAESFLKYMLFTEEAPLKSRIEGDALFAKDFQSLGPKDAKGRSLRDFDLEKRLFKYPCSYLIYSKAFDSLAAPIKDYLYQRLWAILNSKAKDDDFAEIRQSTRRAILEILVDTKSGLPSYWKKDVVEADGSRGAR